jgi:hypothetical protein
MRVFVAPGVLNKLTVPCPLLRANQCSSPPACPEGGRIRFAGKGLPVAQQCRHAAQDWAIPKLYQQTHQRTLLPSAWISTTNMFKKYYAQQTKAL